jgi:hypothetical protein
MKKILFTFCILHFTFYTLHSLPAFPGAEGFGAETPGGRGGQVLFVTNLNPSGAGSFKAALLTSGPRIVVFKVSGVVQGQGEIYLQAENHSYLTVAGQTSPGGITVTTDNGTPIWQYGDVKFHDGIWRFVRFRVPRASGGNGGDHAFEQYKSRNWIIDHCDFSGGDDECLDICYARHFTVQWSTIANSGPGGQCYGVLIAYTAPPESPLGHLSFHHNLIANHSKRGPEFHWLWKDIPDSGQVDFRSNIVYNVNQYGTAFWGVADSTGERLNVNLVGNYWKVGPAHSYDYFPPVNAEKGVQIYIKDNFWSTTGKATAIRYNITDPNDPDTVLCVQYGKQPTLVSSAWNFPPVTTQPAHETYDTVLAKVGAWPRDEMAARTINDVKNGTGTLGDHDEPYIISGPAAPADADNDGMPDFWETGMGLNPNSASDNSADNDGDGYTNIEEYLNDLALARLCQDYYNHVYPIPSDWPDYNPSCCKSLAVEQARAKGHRYMSLSVNPNPLAGSRINISIKGMDKINGALQIINSRGQRVVQLPVKTRIQWNGRDAQGRPVAPCVYVVRLTTDKKEVLQKRLVVIR